MNALPILLLGGAALMMMGGKKNGKKANEMDGGKGGLPPWWTEAMGSARAQAEERAKQCSNPEAFLAAVDQAFKQRRDEYLDDVHAELAANGVSPGEGSQLGLAFKSDLQMFIDNLFTVHCG